MPWRRRKQIRKNIRSPNWYTTRSCLLSLLDQLDDKIVDALKRGQSGDYPWPAGCRIRHDDVSQLRSALIEPLNVAMPVFSHDVSGIMSVEEEVCSNYAWKCHCDEWNGLKADRSFDTLDPQTHPFHNHQHPMPYIVVIISLTQKTVPELLNSILLLL